MPVIDELFAKLRVSGRKAFMPFITAGDPDLEFTHQLLRELDILGCSLLELGIPYSDPIADGPVIQASYTRALKRQIALSDILDMTSQVTSEIKAPLVTMVSYAIVYRFGLERYVAAAKQAGVVGAIIPDLLIEEAGPMAEICRREDFSLIQLVTPTTPRDRAVRIAESSSGFLYYVSVTGITGERQQLPSRLVDEVSWLREQTDLPICIGFGISQPEHVRMLAPVADGLIVGSALVRRVAEAQEKDRAAVMGNVCELASELLNAM